MWLHYLSKTRKIGFIKWQNCMVLKLIEFAYFFIENERQLGQRINTHLSYKTSWECNCCAILRTPVWEIAVTHWFGMEEYVIITLCKEQCTWHWKFVVLLNVSYVYFLICSDSCADISTNLGNNCISKSGCSIRNFWLL